VAAGIDDQIDALLSGAGPDARERVLYAPGFGAGRAAAVEAAAGRVAAPLVVVVDALDGGDLRRLVAAGARGLVLVSELEAALLPALAATAAGSVVIPAPVYLRVVRPALSFREKQTLGMVVLGLSNAEIAAKLYLTESAVKTHLSNAFAKLGVRSRREATAAILDPESGLGTGILEITPEEERISVRARPRRSGQGRG